MGIFDKYKPTPNEPGSNNRVVEQARREVAEGSIPKSPVAEEIIRAAKEGGESEPSIEEPDFVVNTKGDAARPGEKPKAA